jgi:hypothetical protein
VPADHSKSNGRDAHNNPHRCDPCSAYPKRKKKHVPQATGSNVGHLPSTDPRIFLYQIGGNEKGYQDPRFQYLNTTIYNVINFSLPKIRLKMSYLRIHAICRREPTPGATLKQSPVNRLQNSSILLPIHAVVMELRIFKNRH